MKLYVCLGSVNHSVRDKSPMQTNYPWLEPMSQLDSKLINILKKNLYITFKERIFWLET